MHRATSPSSKSPSPTRKDRGTMERPLPVYSDFSHMSGAGGVGTVKFVVGLREDNPDAIIARVFPLTKIVPGEVKEKKAKPKPKKVVVEDKTCQRADCAARKEKLANMKDENKGLRMKVKAIEGKVDTVRNKIALNEKSILLAEEKNDTLNGQIEESQTKIVTMTADVEKAESFNRLLYVCLLYGLGVWELYHTHITHINVC
ncbi:hypothetical protein EON63_06015 [archaeon]|nr:MAG: hypothetical protein EON63_06015 [archaeon]